MTSIRLHDESETIRGISTVATGDDTNSKMGGSGGANMFQTQRTGWDYQGRKNAQGQGLPYLANVANLTEPQSPDDVPYFLHFPRSGGSTVQDVVGNCLGMTVASDGGGFATSLLTTVRCQKRTRETRMIPHSRTRIHKYMLADTHCWFDCRCHSPEHLHTHKPTHSRRYRPSTTMKAMPLLTLNSPHRKGSTEPNGYS